MSVEKGFDSRAEKRRCWVARKTLALQIKDNRMAQGIVLMSTRVIAAALQRIVFEHIDMRVTIPGSMIVQTKAKSLEEAERLRRTDRLDSQKGKGKLLAMENGRTTLLPSESAGK